MFKFENERVKNKDDRAKIQTEEKKEKWIKTVRKLKRKEHRENEKSAEKNSA